MALNRGENFEKISAGISEGNGEKFEKKLNLKWDFIKKNWWRNPWSNIWRIHRIKVCKFVEKCLNKLFWDKCVTWEEILGEISTKVSIAQTTKNMQEILEEFRRKFLDAFLFAFGNLQWNP